MAKYKIFINGAGMILISVVMLFTVLSDRAGSGCSKQCSLKREFKALSFNATIDTFYYDKENHNSRVIMLRDVKSRIQSKFVLHSYDTCNFFGSIHISDHIMKEIGRDYIVREGAAGSNDTFCIGFYCNENE